MSFPTYDGFTPREEGVTHDDVYSTDSMSGFASTISVYMGITKGARADSSLQKDDNKNYVLMGAAYSYLYIELSTVWDRIYDKNVGLKDFEALQKSDGAKLFPLWSKGGGLVSSIPSRLAPDPGNDDFNKWDMRYRNTWVTLWHNISEACPPIPYSVYARFIQPSTSTIQLVFTPADKTPVFDVAQLKVIIDAAFADEELALLKYSYSVMSWVDAKDKGLKLVGRNYFDFFFTWMLPTHFEQIWTDQGTPELQRNWPRDTDAISMDTTLHGGKPGAPGGETTQVNMSQTKVAAAVNQRKFYRDQGTVMGGSATVLAKKFWPAQTLRPNAALSDAEWLHRNAFRFGGVRETIDLASSQNRLNIVFGTNESNTCMIRAENAIIRLLYLDSLMSGDNKRTGQLTTTNQWTGNVNVLEANGSTTPKAIDGWVEKQKFMWLSICLHYDWTMTCPDLSPWRTTFNVKFDFNPFSQHIPLRVEALLDDYFWDYIEAKLRAGQSPSDVASSIIASGTVSLPITTNPASSLNSGPVSNITNPTPKQVASSSDPSDQPLKKQKSDPTPSFSPGVPGISFLAMPSLTPPSVDGPTQLFAMPSIHADPNVASLVADTSSSSFSINNATPATVNIQASPDVKLATISSGGSHDLASNSSTTHPDLAINLEHPSNTTLSSSDAPIGPSTATAANPTPTATSGPLHVDNPFSTPISGSTSTAADLEPLEAWSACTNDLPSFNVRGMKLNNPKAASSFSTPQVTHFGVTPIVPVSRTAPLPPHPGLIVATPGSTPPAQGFVLVGDVALFGVSTLVAEMEVWEGPAPAGIAVPSNQIACIERATVQGDLSLSSVIHALSDTPFDNITFSNVIFFRQNCDFDRTKAIGWHLNADWAIDEKCGSLYQVLKNILNVDEPILSIHAALGMDTDWGHPLSPQGLTLEGLFAGMNVTIADHIHLTSVGVRLFGSRTMKYEPEPHTALAFGFAMFGEMQIDVPGSVVPLGLDYEIREASGTVMLAGEVSGDLWSNPMGIQGLQLSNVCFSTSFSLTSPLKTFIFDVSAQFQHELTQIDFSGSYAAGGDFSLSATVQHFDIYNVGDIFEHITNKEFISPDVDVKIDSATVSIASHSGLQVILQNIDLAGHTAANATLSISSTGFLIRGDLTTDAVEFGDVQLKKAYLQFAYEATDSGKHPDVIVGGEVVFSSITFDAAVHLYTSTRGTEWTVMAALTTNAETLALSKVVPELKGSPFDLALSHVVFVAASQNDPEIGSMVVSGYQFYQGVQVCATLDEIAPLNSLIRHPVPGLILNAGWSKASGFDLTVILPTPITLSLGNGITTTPFELKIQTTPIQLALSAGLSVPVAHSPTPLLFTFSLALDVLGATAVGEMKGWWVDPFGISDKVKIGPDLALAIEIIFAQFVSTGTPSGFGIRGGLMIGNTNAQFALRVSEDPMREVLYGQVQNLNLVDIVAFAEDVAGVAIPRPPANILDFQNLEIYICPATVTLGSVTYSQGFSFTADMTLFGKQADISCTVAKTGVAIKGVLDNFQLGPLAVEGVDSPQAVIDCAIQPSTQHILVDGKIVMFEFEEGLRIDIQFQPTFVFQFMITMKFTDITFQLSGRLIGSSSIKDIKDADFSLDALLEQHILQDINQELQAQFQRARQAAEAGIDIAQKQVDEEEKSLQDSISKAQAVFDAASKTWNAKSKQVTDQSNATINNYNVQITKLQGDVDRAQQQFNTDMANAQKAVQAANVNRASAMANAQHNVDNAQRNLDQGIASGQAALNQATTNMNHDFGSANADIERARANVQSIQSKIDDLNRTLNDYKHSSNIGKKIAIPGVMASIKVVEASKATADGVLQAAEGVLKSSKYLGEAAALDTARKALDASRVAGSAALDVAKKSLQATDVATQAAVTAANKTLQGVQTGASYVALQGAIKALQAYKQANSAVVDAANVAIKGLIQCSEYVAYQAASTALNAAKGATKSLDAAKGALDVARTASKDGLAVGGWVVQHSTEAFDIRVVHLSGTVRGLIGADNKVSKPLTAHVEGVVADKPFTLDGEFDPRKMADFITGIFKKLWNEIEHLV